MARFDERITRSDVAPGLVERADFFDAASNRWVAGELVHLEDLVLHDAQMDIRVPPSWRLSASTEKENLFPTHPAKMGSEAGDERDVIE